MSAVSTGPRARARAGGNPGFVPVLLRGEVQEAVPLGRELVLALNGRVAAVAPVNLRWMGPPTFSAIVPERLLREGENSIKGYWTS